MSNRFLMDLADIKKQWPDIWKEVESFYFRRNIDLPDWPYWCFLPMAGFWGAIDESKPDITTVEALPTIAALGKWRYTMGYYTIDADVLTELTSSEFAGKVPVDVLLRLPQWCMYIETPHLSELKGFFVHLEFDIENKRKELRVVLDLDSGTDVSDYQNLILHLEHDSLLDCLLSVADSSSDMLDMANDMVADKGLFCEIGKIDQLGELMSHAVVESTAPVWRKILPLILYFCTTPDDENNSFAVRYTNPQPKKTKKGYRLFPADGIKHHKVGNRDGDTIRRLRQEVRIGGLSDRTVKPHIRRAHWHGYWKGPRDSDERDFIYKWLPPTIIGGDG